MNSTCILLFSLAVGGILAAQENASKAKATSSQSFAPGGTVRMHLSPGAYEIVGADSKSVVVTYTTNTEEQLKRVKVQIKANGPEAELSIHNSPHNNFHATIEVPSRSDLWVRLGAGDLNVSNVEGNKDIENHAGDIDIRIPHPEEYGPRDASVTAGDIDASAFEVSKGGLFRSFHQLGPGKYKLHVHVGAGDVTLSATK
jgi:hypothetical protein